jgi:PhnB protein
MGKQSLSEQLDKIVAALLAPEAGRSPNDGSRRPGTTLERHSEVIGGLKNLPRRGFRARLKADLERRAEMGISAAKASREFHTSTPYLSLRGAAAAIEFYKKAFGATEELRLSQPDGRIAHAAINIGGARIMLADELPEIGFLSAESLGGSPIMINLDVEDVDAFASRAIAAGATVVRSVADQFYGDRSGHLRDPFGYIWVVSTHKESLSSQEIQRRSEELSRQRTGATSQPNQSPEGRALREGFHSVTPYLILTGADSWIEFVKQGFGAQEHLRIKRPGTRDVIMHAEVKIGDSMIELAEANEQFPAMPSAIWLRVDDVDAVYQRALEAGAASIHAPSDQEYGSRDGSVKDRSGNHWYIYTPKPGNALFEGLHSVTPYLHPLRGAVLIEFLRKAFGAQEVYRAQSPDGVIHHAQVRIGDSMIGLGDAHGAYQPMPSTLHLYVPDADATYERALRAGASSIQPPTDQPYGERNAGVADPIGNRYFLATPIHR